MSQDIANVVVKVESRDAQSQVQSLEVQIQKLQGSAARTGSTATSGFREMASAAGTVAAAVAVAVAAGAAGLHKLAQNASDINDKSSSLGVSAENWQKLANAMSLGGVSAEKTYKMMSSLDDVLSQAKGGDTKAIDKFLKLGITLKEVQAAEGASDVLFKVVDAYNKIGDKDALGDLLGGKKIARQAIGPLNDILKDGFPQMVVASNASIKALDDLGDKLETLEKQMKSAAMNGVKPFVTALNSLADVANAAISGDTKDLSPKQKAVVKGIHEAVKQDNAFWKQVLLGAQDFEKGAEGLGKAVSDAYNAKTPDVIDYQMGRSKSPWQSEYDKGDLDSERPSDFWARKEAGKNYAGDLPNTEEKATPTSSNQTVSNEQEVARVALETNEAKEKRLRLEEQLTSVQDRYLSALRGSMTDEDKIASLKAEIAQLEEQTANTKVRGDVKGVTEDEIKASERVVKLEELKGQLHSAELQQVSKIQQKRHEALAFLAQYNNQYSIARETAQKIVQLEDILANKQHEVVVSAQEEKQIRKEIADNQKLAQMQAAVKEHNDMEQMEEMQAMMKAWSSSTDELIERLGNSTNAVKQGKQIVADMIELNKRLANNELDQSQAIRAGIALYIAEWGTANQQVVWGVKQVAQTMEYSMTDGFMEMIKGTKSVKQAFSDMGLAIIEEMARVAMQLLVVRPLMMSIMNSALFQGAMAAITPVGPQGAGAGAAPVSGGAGTGHTGWADGGYRRFHTGGLMPDEVPIAPGLLGKRGEAVIPQQDLNRQSDGGKPAVNILNVWDPQMIGEHISKNKHWIYNVLATNPEEFRAALGVN